MKELIEIQSSLVAPKDKKNTFGNYTYRSAEQILESVKPLLKKYNCTLTISDDLVQLGDRFYVKATATIRNSSGETESTTAFAREQEDKKGMDQAQVTGSASSYARKYALGGLLAIDDNKDPDTMDNREEGKKGNPQLTKASTNPLEPASTTTGRPVISEGNERWYKAISYCRRNKCSAEVLRKSYDISDADIRTMNAILSEENTHNNF